MGSFDRLVCRVVRVDREGGEQVKQPTRYRANNSLIGKLFLQRLDNGTMIDRDEQKLRGTRKNPKHLKLPDELSRFFRKVGEEQCP